MSRFPLAFRHAMPKLLKPLALPDSRQSETSLFVARGTRRLLRRLNFSTVTELPLLSGRGSLRRDRESQRACVLDAGSLGQAAHDMGGVFVAGAGEAFEFIR